MSALHPSCLHPRRGGWSLEKGLNHTSKSPHPMLGEDSKLLSSFRMIPLLSDLNPSHCNQYPHILSLGLLRCWVWGYAV